MLGFEEEEEVLATEEEEEPTADADAEELTLDEDDEEELLPFDDFLDFFADGGLTDEEEGIEEFSCSCNFRLAERVMMLLFTTDSTLEEDSACTDVAVWLTDGLPDGCRWSSLSLLSLSLLSLCGSSFLLVILSKLMMVWSWCWVLTEDEDEASEEEEEARPLAFNREDRLRWPLRSSSSSSSSALFSALMG